MPTWPEGYRVMVTGHRDVRGERAVVVRQALERVLTKLKERHPDGLVAVCGMAVGADTEFGEVSVQLGCPLVAAIPTDTQSDPWPIPARVRYQVLLNQAVFQVNVWEEPGYETIAIGSRFHARNRWMIDHTMGGAAIAVWDGRQAGGTWAAVREILRHGRKVLVIDPRSGQMRVEHPKLRPEAKTSTFGMPYGVKEGIIKNFEDAGVHVPQGGVLDLFASAHQDLADMLDSARYKILSGLTLDTSEDKE